MSIRIGDLSHRITVCAASEVVSAAGGLVLERKTAFDAWAAIEAKRGSQFARDGGTFDASKVRTHKVTLRARPDFPLTQAAWIHEPRRLSLPLWYRVLSEQSHCDGHWWLLDVALVQRSDDAAPRDERSAKPPLIPASPGFRL